MSDLLVTESWGFGRGARIDRIVSPHDPKRWTRRKHRRVRVKLNRIRRAICREPMYVGKFTVQS